jgi:DNA-binding response OmpR family regulator
MSNKKIAKILIVEDDRPMAKALELKFKKSGFEVEVASNGKQALDFLSKGSFSLVLLDLIMPEMDGFQVLEEIKKKKLKVKVIVTSNLSQEEDFKRAKDLGAIDYLVKSDVTIKEIVDKVMALI